MMTDSVGEDFYLRGQKPQYSNLPATLRSTDLTLKSPADGVLQRARKRSDNEFYLRRHVEIADQQQQEEEAATASKVTPESVQQKVGELSPNRSYTAARLLPSEEQRWFLNAPHIRQNEFSVDKRSGRPQREITPEERRAGLMGSLLAASDITRAAAMVPVDKSLCRTRIAPIDFDPLAARFFPATLGTSYRVRDQIEEAAVYDTPAVGEEADSAVAKSLTYSPPGSGLPYPPAPWRVSTQHNADQLAPTFKSVSEHLAEAIPRAKSSQRMLLSDKAPATASAEVFVSSPYAVELAQLRMQRLRIEEQILMEVKRQQELERTAPPKDRWYALKTPQFHYEARKNNELLRSGIPDPEFDAELQKYRQQLMEESGEFADTFASYARVRSGAIAY